MGGWDGAIWDDFPSWICPFPVGDMDRPLSHRGYGPAPFPHLLSSCSPSVMRFTATRCIYVCCEIGMPSWAHGDTFNVSVVEHHFLPLVSSDLFCYVMELSIGDRVVYTRSTGLRVPAKVVGLLQDGHVELEYDQGGVQAIYHRCPTDSISFGIPNLESPPPSPSIPAIDVPLKVPLDPHSRSLPNTTIISFPNPRLHWVMVNLEIESLVEPRFNFCLHLLS